jgi:MFS family permease
MDSISRLSRKITFSLFYARSFSSAGMIAMGTMLPIVSAELSGRPSWAGIPTTVYLVAGSLAAYLWGRLITRIGWRLSLFSGFILGLFGGGVVAMAVEGESWGVLLLAMVMVGAGNSAMNLSRFAAAEVNPPDSRGKAISTVVLGGTVGAIAGPLIVGPTSLMAVTFGSNELSGPFIGGAVLFLLAAIVVLVSLKPEPVEIGRKISELYPEDVAAHGEPRSIGEILRQRTAGLAVLAMVLGQTVMVFLMAITSLYMRNHEHGLGNISVVISSHTFGMFAFSIISGRLADRFGRGLVIAIGAGTLVVSTLIAPLSTEFIPLSIALFLLGLGWNFCYVGGSALLADQLSPAERGPMQGFNDLLVGSVSALGSLSSGFAYAALGFGFMNLIGLIFSIVLVVLTLLWMRSQKQLAVGEAV